MKVVSLVALASVLAFSGCNISYTWRSSVPEGQRQIAVPVFRNSSDVTELGAVVTRQILREVQREGTFRVTSLDACAIEIQGEVKNASSHTIAYERKTGARTREHRFSVEAVVSFVDKRAGTVLVNNRTYKASTTYLANDDVTTGERDASGRLAEDLSRQIVDDLLMVLSTSDNSLLL